MKDRTKLCIFAVAGAFTTILLCTVFCFVNGFIKQRPIIMDKPAPPLTYSEAFSTTCEVLTTIEVVLPTIILGIIIGLIIGLTLLSSKQKSKRTWEIDGPSGTHVICIEHAYWQGGATIKVDDSVIYQRTRKIVDWGLKQTFIVDKLDCILRIVPMPWFTFRYYLLINGTKIKPYQPEHSSDVASAPPSD